MWSKSDHDECVKKVRTELRDANLVGDSATVRFLLKKLDQVKLGHCAKQELEALVISNLILIANERAQILRATYVKKLFDMIEMIIYRRKAGKKRNRQLNFLNSNFHALKSQYHRRTANIFLAEWEQGMALASVSEQDAETLAFHQFSWANRLLRSGRASQAARILGAAVPLIGESKRQHALTSLSIAYRLSRQVQQARNLIATEFGRSEGDFRLHLQWEGFLLDISESGSRSGFDEILSGVRRGQRFAESGRIIECFLFHQCHADEFVRKLAPSLKTLRKRAGFEPAKWGPFFLIAEQIQMLRDQDGVNEVILSDLGQQLSEVERIRSVDHEILCWAAAARTLACQSEKIHSAICISRYQDLSRKTTEGQSDDCLGLLPDLTNQ